MTPRLPAGFRRRGDAIFRDFSHRGQRVRVVVGHIDDVKAAIRHAPAVERAERARIDARQPETVADLATLWLRRRVASKRAAKGVRTTEQRLRHHILPGIGDRVASMLSQDDLWCFLRKLETTAKRRGEGKGKGKGLLSKQTIKHILADVRCLLRYGETARGADGEFIIRRDRNPWTNDLIPKIEMPLPKALSDAEVDRIMDACTNWPQEFTIRLLLLTGLRWGEFRRLEWSDLHMDPVPHLTVTRTKSKRPRLVPLVEEAEELLQEHRRRTAALSGNISPYPCPNGGNLAARLSRRAGFHFHVHQLRHTWGTRMRRAGLALGAIQAGMGHLDASTTQRYAPESFDMLTLALRAVRADQLRSCTRYGRCATAQNQEGKA